jgi:hypothetical protein
LAQSVGAARVASAEAGVSGLSVDALMTDFFAQEARYRDSLRQNLGYVRNQLQREGEGATTVAKGRVQSIQPFLASPVNQPNYLAAGLRIGGDALKTYERYRYKGSSTSTTRGEN